MSLDLNEVFINLKEKQLEISKAKRMFDADIEIFQIALREWLKQKFQKFEYSQKPYKTVVYSLNPNLSNQDLNKISPVILIQSIYVGNNHLLYSNKQWVLFSGDVGALGISDKEYQVLDRNAYENFNLKILEEICSDISQFIHIPIKFREYGKL
jgi:hypothetical protein